MTPIVCTYLAYLLISIALTFWVARTLHRNGRIFLVDCFHGNEPLADSLNHLLVVGFYLINLGYVTLALKSDDKPGDLQGILETLSTKVGGVLLILGAMHFFNLVVFSKMRSWRLRNPCCPPSRKPELPPKIMITFAPFQEDLLPERPRLHWLPLVLFTTAACVFTVHVDSWARMWLIAIALFAGFKWWTWRRVVDTGLHPSLARTLAYLCLWPGMSARTFLARTQCPERPAFGRWAWALAKTLLGAILVWGIARFAGHGLLAGWIGMVGFIFLLHFGLFALLSLFWRSRGLDAAPLMNFPLAASSLHDFWGRRWNAGFRDIVFVLFFFPLARRVGTGAAALLTFGISGLIHELVITIPAGAGYGLPTLYFALQGVGLMLERSRHLAAGKLTRSWLGRAFTFAVVVLPLFSLFPPVFVERVMVPFFQFIKALS